VYFRCVLVNKKLGIGSVGKRAEMESQEMLSISHRHMRLIQAAHMEELRKLRWASTRTRNRFSSC
jgi:hypothetical protein